MSTLVNTSLAKHFADYFETQEVKQLYYELGLEPEASDKEQLVFELLKFVGLQGRFDALWRVACELRPEFGRAFDVEVLPNPYKGLAFFQTEDRERFFGREQVAERLLDLVQQHRFVALIGVSGSGKSSLFHAGLVPLLPSAWRVAIWRPRKHPLVELSNSLSPLLYDGLDKVERKAKSKALWQQLESGGLDLRDVVELVLEETGAERVLVVADQFEEFYTLVTEEMRQLVLQQLLGVVQSELACTVLLGYRADFTGQVIRSFGQLLNDEGTLFLNRMSDEELAAAIEKPALQQGVVFEDGLVGRLVEDVGDEVKQAQRGGLNADISST